MWWKGQRPAPFRSGKGAGVDTVDRYWLVVSNSGITSEFSFSIVG